MVTGKTARTTAFGPVQVGIILLALATALIHFYLNVLMGRMDVLFTLNGLGYLGLLGALFLPIPIFARNRGLVRVVFILFTLITIAAWVILGARNGLGYVDKVIEAALAALLWLDRRRTERTTG